MLAFESGATPVVVLTKADLVDRDASRRGHRRLRARRPPASTVIVTSAVTGAGIDELRALATPGPHGRADRRVGRREVDARERAGRRRRAGDRRRARERSARPPHHDGTRARLLPGGGVLVDTPGLRAVRCGMPTRAQPRVRRHRGARARSAGSTTARTTANPGARCTRRSRTASSTPARFEHYRELDAELDASRTRRRARASLSKAQPQHVRPARL